MSAKRSMAMLLVMLIAFATSKSVSAQDQRFINYNMSDGLPSDIIYAVAESESGYLWFGSEAGISRFDGHQFDSVLLDRGGFAITNSADHAQPPRLPGASVQYLYSRQGKIYAALESAGVAVLDENLQLLQLLTPDNTATMPAATIWSMAAAGPEQMWMGFSNDGLSLYDEPTQTFTPYVLPRSTYSLTQDATAPSILSILVDDNDSVWISALREGLLRKTANSEQFERVGLAIADSPQPGPTLLPNYIRSIAYDEQFIYALNSKKLFLLNKHTAELHAVIDIEQQLGPQWSTLLTMSMDEDGRLWVGSLIGLFSFRLNAARDAIAEAQHFQHSPALADSIGNNQIYYSIADQHGGLWFVSMLGGVIHRPNGWDAFQLLRRDPLAEATLSDNRVRSLLADGSQLWIGSFTEGIIGYDLDNNIYSTPEALLKLTKNLPNANRVNAMTLDQQQRLWLTLNKSIVNHSATEGLQVSSIEDGQRDSYSNRFIRSIFATDERLWARWDSRYLMFYDQPLTLWRAFDVAPYFPANSDLTLLEHAVLDDGDFLLASREQVLRYDADCHCLQDFIQPDQLPVQTMLVAGQRLFLVRGNQLLEYALRRQEDQLDAVQLLHSWPLPNDLSQDGINNLLLQDPQTLWLSSARALLRLRLEQAGNKAVSLRVITHSDGLPNMELEPDTLQQLDDGRLIIAGTGGVALIQPDLISDDLPLPTVMLQQVRSNNGPLPGIKPSLAATPAAHPTMALPFNENTLFINFQSVLFSHREQLRFQYRLLGWNADWISSGTTPQAIYSNLPHGDYQFEVQARIGNQPWGPVNADLHWSIQRPPWLSPAAISAYCIAALLLLGLSWRLRLRYHRQQQALALADERQRFARQQSELATRLNRSIQPEDIALAIFETIHAQMPLRSMHVHFFSNSERWHDFPAQQVASMLDVDELYQQLQQQTGVQTLNTSPLSKETHQHRHQQQALLMPLGSQQPYQALAVLYSQQAPDQEQLGLLNLASSMAGSAVDNCELLQQVTRLAETNRRANEAKSEFIAMVSHEIRTPLHGLMGMLHLLDERRDLPQREFMLNKVNHSSAQLLAVLDDVLDIAKIEAKKIELRHDLFNLQQLCDQLGDLFLGKVQAKRIYLVCLLAPDLIGWRHGDQDRCMQILTNLVSNAIKFTERGGIIVTVRKQTDERLQQDDVLFEVHDSGIGIRSEDQQRLFQRFEQVGEMTWQRYGGSGLGLAISHHLCQVLGGALSVTSTPGEGSVFRASLPLPVPVSLHTIKPLPRMADMCIDIDCDQASAALASLLQGIARVRVLGSGADIEQDEPASVRLLLTTSLARAKASRLPTALLRNDIAAGEQQELAAGVFYLPQHWQQLLAWILAHHRLGNR